MYRGSRVCSQGSNYYNNQQFNQNNHLPGYSQNASHATVPRQQVYNIHNDNIVSTGHNEVRHSDQPQCYYDDRMLNRQPPRINQPYAHQRPMLQSRPGTKGAYQRPPLQSRPGAYQRPTFQSQPGAYQRPTLHSRPGAYQRPTLHSRPAAHQRPTLHSQPAAHQRTHSCDSIHVPYQAPRNIQHGSPILSPRYIPCGSPIPVRCAHSPTKNSMATTLSPPQGNSTKAFVSAPSTPLLARSPPVDRTPDPSSPNPLSESVINSVGEDASQSSEECPQNREEYEIESVISIRLSNEQEVVSYHTEAAHIAQTCQSSAEPPPVSLPNQCVIPPAYPSAEPLPISPQSQCHNIIQAACAGARPSLVSPQSECLILAAYSDSRPRTRSPPRQCSAKPSPVSHQNQCHSVIPMAYPGDRQPPLSPPSQCHSMTLAACSTVRPPIVAIPSMLYSVAPWAATATSFHSSLKSAFVRTLNQSISIPTQSQSFEQSSLLASSSLSSVRVEHVTPSCQSNLNPTAVVSSSQLNLKPVHVPIAPLHEANLQPIPIAPSSQPSLNPSHAGRQSQSNVKPTPAASSSQSSLKSMPIASRQFSLTPAHAAPSNQSSVKPAPVVPSPQSIVKQTSVVPSSQLSLKSAIVPSNQSSLRVKPATPSSQSNFKPPAAVSLNQSSVKSAPIAPSNLSTVKPAPIAPSSQSSVKPSPIAPSNLSTVKPAPIAPSSQSSVKPSPIAPSNVSTVKPALIALSHQSSVKPSPIAPSSQSKLKPAPIAASHQSNMKLAPVGPSSQFNSKSALVAPSSQSSMKTSPITPSSQSSMKPATIAPSSQSSVKTSPIAPSSQSSVKEAPIVPSSQSSVKQAPIVPSSQTSLKQAPIAPSSQSSVKPSPITPSSQSSVKQAPIAPSSQSSLKPSPIGPSIQSSVKQAPIAPVSQSSLKQAPVAQSSQSNFKSAPVCLSSQSSAKLVPIAPVSQSSVKPAPIAPSNQPSGKPAPVAEPNQSLSGWSSSEIVMESEEASTTQDPAIESSIKFGDQPAEDDVDEIQAQPFIADQGGVLCGAIDISKVKPTDNAVIEKENIDQISEDKLIVKDRKTDEIDQRTSIEQITKESMGLPLHSGDEIDIRTISEMDYEDSNMPIIVNSYHGEMNMSNAESGSICAEREMPQLSPVEHLEVISVSFANRSQQTDVSERADCVSYQTFTDELNIEDHLADIHICEVLSNDMTDAESIRETRVHPISCSLKTIFTSTTSTIASTLAPSIGSTNLSPHDLVHSYTTVIPVLTDSMHFIPIQTDRTDSPSLLLNIAGDRVPCLKDDVPLRDSQTKCTPENDPYATDVDEETTPAIVSSNQAGSDGGEKTQIDTIEQNDSSVDSSDIMDINTNDCIAYTSYLEISDDGSDDEILNSMPAILQSIQEASVRPIPTTPEKNRQKHARMVLRSPDLDFGESDSAMDQSTMQRAPQISSTFSLDSLLADKTKEEKRNQELAAMQAELLEGIRQGSLATTLNSEHHSDFDDLMPEHKKHLDNMLLADTSIMKLAPGECVFNSNKFGCLFLEDLGILNCGFIPGNTATDRLLSRMTPDRASIILSDKLISLCSEKIASKAALNRWIFFMMSVHPSLLVTDSCKTILCEILFKQQNFHTCKHTWAPAVKDVIKVFVNYGADASDLLRNSVTNKDIEELQTPLQVRNNEQVRDPVVNQQNILNRANMRHVVEIIARCVQARPEYTSEEVNTVIIILCRVAMDSSLMNHMLSYEMHVCLSSLLQLYTEQEWPHRVEILCEVLRDLSGEHHHNKLHLVRLFPSCTRGKYLQTRLSYTFLCDILKLTPDCMQLRNFKICHLHVFVPLISKLINNDLYLACNVITLIDLCVSSKINISEKDSLSTLMEQVGDLAVNARDSVHVLDKTRVKDMLIRLSSKWSILLQSTGSKQMSLFAWSRGAQPKQTLINCQQSDHDSEHTEDQHDPLENPEILQDLHDLE